MVVDGAGIELVVDGRFVPLGPLDPLRFDGEADTSCSLLGGPTRDLNLMTRRGRCTGTIDGLAVGEATRSTRSRAGRFSSSWSSGEVVVDGLALGPRDVLVVSDPVVLHGSATAALVTVRPAGPA